MEYVTVMVAFVLVCCVTFFAMYFEDRDYEARRRKAQDLMSRQR